MNRSSISEKHQANLSSIKLLQILECLSESRMPMRLQDIALQVHISQSTVLRYLYALQDAGYIYQEVDTLRYALTWRVCKLSEKVNSLLSLRNITTPFINNLANMLSLGACLVVNQDDSCLYLDCIDNPNSPTLQRIGKTAPLHATGSGKILLSCYNDIHFNSYVKASGLAKFTDNTITDPEVLKRQLDMIRETGIAYDNEECEIGLKCISLPLRDFSGQIIAAISVFGNTYSVSDQRINEEILPMLQQIQSTICYRLGYNTH